MTLKVAFQTTLKLWNAILLELQNLLENLKTYKQFIYVSTSEIYGHQDNEKLFIESMKAHPISPYSIGKYSGELYAQMHMRHMKKPIKRY